MLLQQSSLALLTDLYQLTMASGYWKHGTAEREAVFHLFFRSNPFQGGYVVAAGLQIVVDWIQSFRLKPDDIQYLATLTGNDGEPLFESAFLQYLSELRLTVDVDAMSEGTVVFPSEPMIRVRGPMLQCQLLETALLNIINFQSLIATRASRTVRAAQGDDVLEFGLRRAQGIDGALAASRAAFIGGCSATSNVLAGKLYGIPVRGTHAHSWVMSFETELAAFMAYAEAMPNNCVFLVDTYDTLEGVRKAIQAGQHLRQSGHRLAGIRLDSGDLATLSIEARRLLDEAGFVDAKIVASNDLDERLIQSLKMQGAKIGVWGVGTKLVTAYEQPALGGVYKLGAIRAEDGHWRPTVKLSEQPIKTSIPGILQVQRFFDHEGKALGDMICSELLPERSPPRTVDPLSSVSLANTPAFASKEDLLSAVFRQGQLVCRMPSLAEIRSRTLRQLSTFPDSVLRFDHPQKYSVGLEEQLNLQRQQMIQNARQDSQHES